LPPSKYKSNAKIAVMQMVTVWRVEGIYTCPRLEVCIEQFRIDVFYSDPGYILKKVHVNVNPSKWYFYHCLPFYTVGGSRYTMEIFTYISILS
jgi:hypothetical protein